MADDLYCKLYVTGAADAAALKAVITAATGQPFERRTSTVNGLVVDVFDSGQRDAQAAASDDFVRWPTYLEIEPVDDTMAEDAFIAALAGLMNQLNTRGLRTVASCDFEDALAAAQQAG